MQKYNNNPKVTYPPQTHKGALSSATKFNNFKAPLGVWGKQLSELLIGASSVPLQHGKEDNHRFKGE